MQLFRRTVVLRALACSLLSSVTFSFRLTRDIMELSQKAMVIADGLNLIENDEELLNSINASFYENALVYSDEPDRAMVARKGGYCFAMFRGTKPRIGDWAQNLNPFYYDDRMCHDGTCCESRMGLTNAYIKTNFREKMTEDILECMQQYCGISDFANVTQDCLVVGGHSQGGGIAAVAAIDLADLNPILISIGSPPSVSKPCDIIDQNRSYLFINTQKSRPFLGSGLKYDPVPFLAFGPADQFGHIIVLGDDLENVAYYGNDVDGPNPQILELSVEPDEEYFSIDVHGSPDYLLRMENILATDLEEIGTNGWVASSYCTRDVECISKHCRMVSKTILPAKQCTGVEGDPCDDDGDCFADDLFCVSGKCRKFGLKNGNYCEDQSDCGSGRCYNHVCVAQLPGGRSCYDDTDCISNQCSFSLRHFLRHFLFKCQ